MDDTEVIVLQKPLEDSRREKLQSSGYFPVHLCWPHIGYCYIFQIPDAANGLCPECGTKYSTKFPTTGKM